MEEKRMNFIDEVTTLQSRFTDDLIKIIDKYAYNRNKEVALIGRITHVALEMTDFTEYTPTERDETITRKEHYEDVQLSIKDAITEFRSNIVDRFIMMCDGNDYSRLNLLTMVDTIDSIYDKHISLIDSVLGGNK